MLYSYDNHCINCILLSVFDEKKIFRTRKLGFQYIPRNKLRQIAAKKFKYIENLLLMSHRFGCRIRSLILGVDVKNEQWFVRLSIRQKMHVYGAFCEAGFGKFAVFTGILNKDRMFKLYKLTLMPTARKFYGDDSSDWLLLEDNYPKHKSNLCNDWKDGKGIEQMYWPPQSPDCNPIENFWSVTKARLKGKRFQNLNELSTFIKRQWYSFPDDYARNCKTYSSNKQLNLKHLYGPAVLFKHYTFRILLISVDSIPPEWRTVYFFFEKFKKWVV